MAPNAARARKIARRAKEEADAAAASIHLVPSSDTVLNEAARAAEAATEQEWVDRARMAGMETLCVSCNTTDPDAFSARM